MPGAVVKVQLLRSTFVSLDLEAIWSFQNGMHPMQAGQVVPCGLQQMSAITVASPDRSLSGTESAVICCGVSNFPQNQREGNHASRAHQIASHTTKE
jgi:hypothetical protein